MIMNITVTVRQINGYSNSSCLWLLCNYLTFSFYYLFLQEDKPDSRFEPKEWIFVIMDVSNFVKFFIYYPYLAQSLGSRYLLKAFKGESLDQCTLFAGN